MNDDGTLAGLITIKDFDKSEKYRSRRRTSRGACAWARRSASSVTRGSAPRRCGMRASTCSSSTPPTASPRASSTSSADSRRTRRSRTSTSSAATSRPARERRRSSTPESTPSRSVSGRVHLHDAHRRGRRRSPGHRRLRGVARRPPGRRPGHRRWRPAVLGRHREGARRGRRRRHDRLAPGRHGRVAG